MSTMSPPRIDRKHARRSQHDRPTASRLASTEYDRVAELFDQLTPQQWRAATDCPGWDVRAMAGHLLGMIQMAASVPELARQQLVAERTAKRQGGLMIDALTQLQIDKNADLTTSAIIDRVRALAPKASRTRRRVPAVIRNRATDEETDGWWTFGYVFDTILTRDPFMHRIDITRATGVPMAVTVEHEGVIVADVVREWAGRHDRSFDLELTGPAGGHWTEGSGADPVVMDAFDFCRALSGRAPATGLLATQVPF